MNQILELKLEGKNINNIKYVDDTTLMAGNEEDLKALLRKKESAKDGLTLNT